LQFHDKLLQSDISKKHNNNVLICFVSAEFSTLESSNNNALNNLEDTSCPGTGVASLYRNCENFLVKIGFAPDISKQRHYVSMLRIYIEYDRYAGYIS